MLLVAPVKEIIRTALSTEDQETMTDPDLLKRVRLKRSSLPAITHIDYSARIQSVSENRNDRYYRLIKKFEQKTGSGVIVNTSFNVRGEPIVSTPQDAYSCFMATEMDILVLKTTSFTNLNSHLQIKFPKVLIFNFHWIDYPK